MPDDRPRRIRLHAAGFAVASRDTVAETDKGAPERALRGAGAMNDS